MQCPRCDSEIERTVSFCPECGLDIESLRERVREEHSAEGDAEDSEGQSETAQQASSSAGQSASSDGAASAEAASGDDRQSSDSDPFRGDDGESSGDAGEHSQSGRATGSGTTQAANGLGGGQSQGQQSNQRGTQSGGGGGNRQRGHGSPNRQAGARGQHAAASEFSLPLVQGAVYGALTYVLNFAAVFGLFAYEMSERSADFTGSQIELHELAGWAFYGAHRVKMESPYVSKTFNYLETVYTDATATTVPKILFYVVPLVGLALAGRALASKATGPRATDKQRFKAGAAVVVGYAALAVVGAATVFSVDLSSLSFGIAQQSGAIKPEMQSAIIFMGVAYPVVAGGIGGYLAD